VEEWIVDCALQPDMDEGECLLVDCKRCVWALIESQTRWRTDMLMEEGESGEEVAGRYAPPPPQVVSSDMSAIKEEKSAKSPDRENIPYGDGTLPPKNERAGNTNSCLCLTREHA
jgi:hypothetical protein